MAFIQNKARPATTPPRRAHAFTLIELLIVIGIILILMSMLLVGAKYIANTGRGNSTRTTLKIATSMLAEYDAVTHLQRQPISMYDSGTATAQPCVNHTATDFWLGAEFALFTPSSPPVGAGLITADSQYTNQNDGILNTAICMNLLSTVVNNTKALGNLPASSVSTQITGANGTRMLLDGWGTPIIYVPAGGLYGVTLSANPSTPGFVTSTGFHTYASGYVETADDHPFFVSAGPDGDLSKGDDNIYSFEN